MSLQAFSGVVLLIATVAAHSNLLLPNPRNAIDRDLPQFANGQFPLVNGSAGCTPTTSVCGCWCTNGTSVCESAQTCLFFSQGCSIGCPTCDGVSSRNQTDICGSGMAATICDPRLRTYNRNATCNSPDDVYKHNPWRAPGQAPVFDVCGKAGTLRNSCSEMSNPNRWWEHAKAWPWCRLLCAHHSRKARRFGEQSKPVTVPTCLSMMVGSTCTTIWDQLASGRRG